MQVKSGEGWLAADPRYSGWTIQLAPFSSVKPEFKRRKGQTAKTAPIETRVWIHQCGCFDHPDRTVPSLSGVSNQRKNEPTQVHGGRSLEEIVRPLEIALRLDQEGADHE